MSTQNMPTPVEQFQEAMSDALLDMQSLARHADFVQISSVIATLKALKAKSDAAIAAATTR